MGPNKTTSSYITSSENDLVNKKYLDITASTSGVAVATKVIQEVRRLNTKVNKSGDTMTGDLNLDPNKIKIRHTPNDDDDVINKKHLDAVVAHRLGDNDLKIITINLSLKANRSGEVFTGPIDMGANLTIQVVDPEDSRSTT